MKLCLVIKEVFGYTTAKKEFLMYADSMNILYFDVLRGGNVLVLHKPWRISCSSFALRSL